MKRVLGTVGAVAILGGLLASPVDAASQTTIDIPGFSYSPATPWAIAAGLTGALVAAVAIRKRRPATARS